MSRIRRDQTKPELILKRMLKGFEYQPKGLFGNPDFVNTKKKMVVFVDGCFWHKCPKCYKEPQTRREFWLPKIERNIARDKEVNKELQKKDWRIIRIWEHEIKKNSESVIRRIIKNVN